MAKRFPDDLPDPLVPKRTGFALKRHGSYPNISKPDRDGFYWDYEEPPDIPAPSAPCISDEQMDRVVNAVNQDLPEGEYPWSASREEEATGPPDNDYLEVRGRPEKGKTGLGENIRSLFRSKSPKERELGARRKDIIEQKSLSVQHKDPQLQIERDRAMAVALSEKIEQRHTDRENFSVSRAEKEELDHLERELKRERERVEKEKERERKKERVGHEARKERIRAELENIRTGQDSHTKDREKKSKDPVKRSNQGGEKSQTRGGSTYGSEYAYSSQDEGPAAPRSRKDPVRHVVQEQRGGTRRERGDAVHHISLDARHRDSSDSSDGEFSPIELVKRVKTLETMSRVGKITVPALANVPYPSDELVGPLKTASYRTITQVYRAFDNHRKFFRQPNEHILVFLRRVKRGIEGNRVRLDDRQFLEFVCHYLDKETADLFHESFDDICDFDKFQFLDFLVTSVSDNAEEGENTFNFWAYEPSLDAAVKNVSTLVTKLSQLKAKVPKYTMEDVINKLMVLLPTEYMEEIKKHRVHKQAVALDVLLFELNKFEKQIAEFLMKGKKKPGMGVRAVYDVVEADGVVVDGVVDGMEHLNMNENQAEYVNYVPFHKYPIDKNEMGTNQYISPPQQQQQQQRQHRQQQQHFSNHGNTQGYTARADMQKQPVCAVCFKYGHNAQTCNKTIYCCLCNGTDHIAPACMVYPGVAPTMDDCPLCLRMFSLRLKHTRENCRLNSKSQFSVDKMLAPNAQGNQKGE